MIRCQDALSVLVDSDSIMRYVVYNDVIKHYVCNVTLLLVFEFNVARKHGALGRAVAEGDISEVSVVARSDHEAIALSDHTPFYENILRWRFEHDAVVAIADVAIVDVNVIGRQIETVSIGGNVIRRRLDRDVSNGVVFALKVSVPGGL